MYSFSYFKEKDKAKILDFLQQHPFAFLTGSTSSGEQVATQIPMLVVEREGNLYLQGHIMKKTDHHKAFLENPSVLAVFTGPHAYVSASWYSNPHMGSTWNYMSVHVAGQAKLMTDEALSDFMRRFTIRFEGGDAHSPTVFNNLPTSYRDKMMPAIVGIEIEAESIRNVFKLSQNRDKESYRNIIARLNEQGGDAEKVARAMLDRMDDLFPT